MSKIYTYALVFVGALIFIYAAPGIVRGISAQYGNIFNPKTRVARITIDNEITQATKYTQTLQEFFKDKSIKAIFLEIDSPGGYTGSCQAINQELVYLKKMYKKPVVAFSTDLCTSGAYYIALAADYIVTCPATLVGSIGCRLSQFKLDKTIGLVSARYEEYKGGTYKDAGMFTATTPEQARMLQGLSDESYQQFIDQVAQVRKLSPKTADTWANGRLFTGARAAKLGLIDVVGSEHVAIEWLKKAAHIKNEIEWIKPAQPSLLSKLLSEPEELQSRTARILEAIASYTSTVHAGIRSHY